MSNKDNELVEKIKNTLGQFAKDNNSDEALQMWAEYIAALQNQQPSVNQQMLAQENNRLQTLVDKIYKTILIIRKRSEDVYAKSYEVNLRLLELLRNIEAEKAITNAESSKPDPRIAQLEAENKRYRDALKNCADDLRAEINDRYPQETRIKYPSIERDYQRDLATVWAAEKLLETTKES